MGMPPPGLVRPQPTAEDLLNRSPNHALDIVASKSGRNVQDDWVYYTSHTGVLPTFWDILVSGIASFCTLLTRFFTSPPPEPDFTDVFPLKSSVTSSSPYGRKREYGTIPLYPYRGSYQPLAPIERSDPPRSISAIIPVLLFEQKDKMIDALQATYHVDASEHVFALSPEYYRTFWRESVLHMHYVGDFLMGNVHYCGIPVIESAEVIGGIVLRPRGGQSHTALLALIQSIEAGIVQRQVGIADCTMSYTPQLEDDLAIVSKDEDD